jgi:hypothetical protein
MGIWGEKFNKIYEETRDKNWIHFWRTLVLVQILNYKLKGSGAGRGGEGGKKGAKKIK